MRTGQRDQIESRHSGPLADWLQTVVEVKWTVLGIKDEMDFAYRDAATNRSRHSTVQSIMMRSALRRLGRASSLVLFAVSLFAANSPASISPSITNFIDPQIVEDNPQVKHLMEGLNKGEIKTDTLLDEHFLFASLLWGSVGTGYLLYARRQRMIVPFIAGVAMIGVSYFVGSWLWMSVISIALMVAGYHLVKQGY
jgi:hypothetical protein